MMKKDLLFSLSKPKPKIIFFGRYSFFILFLLIFQNSFSKSTATVSEDGRIIFDSISNFSQLQIIGGAEIVKNSSNEVDSITHEKANVKEKLAKADLIQKKTLSHKKEKKSVKDDNTPLIKYYFLSDEFLFNQNSRALAVCITPVNNNTLSAIIIKPLKINKCFFNPLSFSVHYKLRFFIDNYSSYLFTRPPPYLLS